MDGREHHGTDTADVSHSLLIGCMFRNAPCSWNTVVEVQYSAGGIALRGAVHYASRQLYGVSLQHAEERV